MSPVPLGRSILVELLKLRTMPMALWLMAAGIALTALFSLVTLGVSARGPQDGLPGLATEEGQRLLLSNGALAGVMTLVLGIVVTAGEYRHGTIVTSLLIEPRRSRMLFVKVELVAALGALVGVLAGTVSVVLGLAGLGLRGIDRVVEPDAVLTAVVGPGVVAAVLAVAGAALGALCREQVLAVAVALVTLYVLDPIASELSSGVARYGPGALTETLSGAAPEGAPSPGVAALVLVACSAVLLVLALRRQARDVA